MEHLMDATLRTSDAPEWFAVALAPAPLWVDLARGALAGLVAGWFGLAAKEELKWAI